MKSQRRLAVIALLHCLWGTLVPSAAAVPVYYAGHADIGVDYLADPARFELKIRFDGNSLFEDGTMLPFQRVAPESVAIRTPDPPILRERKVDEETMEVEYDLTGPEWNFLGVEVGEPLWSMPQTNDPAKPFFGFATDTLNPSQWSGPLAWSLEAVLSAPSGGEISLWQTDFFGSPTVKYASADGVNVVLGGVDDEQDDDFPQGVGGHDHYHWGFSKPGVYRVQLGATGMRVGVGQVHGSGVFTFLVGDAAGQFVDGDYDEDGDVDGADFLLWQRQLGSAVPAGTAADGSGNGVVDEADLGVWRDNFGAQSSSGSASAATNVPEPTAIALLLTALVASRLLDSPWKRRCP
jgi:surface-anchored protein